MHYMMGKYKCGMFGVCVVAYLWHTLTFNLVLKISDRWDCEMFCFSFRSDDKWARLDMK